MAVDDGSGSKKKNQNFWDDLSIERILQWSCNRSSVLTNTLVN